MPKPPSIMATPCFSRIGVRGLLGAADEKRRSSTLRGKARILRVELSRDVAAHTRRRAQSTTPQQKRFVSALVCAGETGARLVFASLFSFITDATDVELIVHCSVRLISPGLVYHSIRALTSCLTRNFGRGSFTVIAFFRARAHAVSEHCLACLRLSPPRRTATRTCREGGERGEG